MVRFVLSSLFAAVALAGTCDDPELDLCETSEKKVTATTEENEDKDANGAVRRASGPGVLWVLGLMLVSGKGPLAPLMMSSFFVGAEAGGTVTVETKCKDMKDLYKVNGCCGNAEKQIHHQLVPGPKSQLSGTNVCEGKKPKWDNTDCEVDGVVAALEQAGADVTRNFVGTLDSSVLTVDGNSKMIRTAYYKAGLCPVNVHWHLGTEHRSEGEFDETGIGPHHAGTPSSADPTRRLSGASVRYGYACKRYDANDAKFTKAYNWQHCQGMHVGETYEVHWPHSTLGACGTPDQYQTPFYDGVFCGYDPTKVNLTGNDTASNVGVQSQVFVIVNDEDYYYPDLMRGMIVAPTHTDKYGADIAIYTGSTTGTSRNNVVCSSYTPITWQVDRKCHLISASSFDKMCADMKQQRDDLTGDLWPHGSRELVAKNLTANNLKDHVYAIPTVVR